MEFDFTSAKKILWEHLVSSVPWQNDLLSHFQLQKLI